MVNVSDSFYNGLYTNKFKRLIEEVNKLEDKIRYNSDGKEDNIRFLKQFMDMWIKDGIV